MTEENGKRLELLRAIAALIPGFEVSSPGDRQPRLTGPDGMEIFIGSSSERGKLHVHGGWPMDGNAYMSPRSWGAVPYDQADAVSIGVSESRGAEAIAREISRRFLPSYQEIYAKCREKQRERGEYRDRLFEQAKTLAKAAGLPQPARLESDKDYRLHVGNASTERWYGDATVYDNSINLDLRGVSVEKTVRILAILRGK